MVDRQQLHGRDAEVLQVGDLLDQPGVGAALVRRDARVGVARKAADVHLVDHGFGERAAAAADRPPSRRLRGVDHDAFHRGGGVVARPAGRRAAVARRAWRRRGRTGRAAPCPGRSAARARARPGRWRGRRRSGPAAGRGRRRASSDRCGACAGSSRDHLRGRGVVGVVEQQQLDRVGLVRHRR